MSETAEIDGHELGPFIGFEAVGFHAICSCGERFEGAHPAEVVDHYEHHYARLTLEAPVDRPGPAKCKAALAAAIRRGKLLPPEVPA
jgi:hypothetical protein